MSYSLNSFKGINIGDYIGTTIGVVKGDTRSLDYSSYEVYFPLPIAILVEVAQWCIPCQVV